MLKGNPLRMDLRDDVIRWILPNLTCRAPNLTKSYLKYYNMLISILISILISTTNQTYSVTFNTRLWLIHVKYKIYIYTYNAYFVEIYPYIYRIFISKDCIVYMWNTKYTYIHIMRILLKYIRKIFAKF